MRVRSREYIFSCAISVYACFSAMTSVRALTNRPQRNSLRSCLRNSSSIPESPKQNSDVTNSDTCLPFFSVSLPVSCSYFLAVCSVLFGLGVRLFLVEYVCFQRFFFFFFLLFCCIYGLILAILSVFVCFFVSLFERFISNIVDLFFLLSHVIFFRIS